MKGEACFESSDVGKGLRYQGPAERRRLLNYSPKRVKPHQVGVVAYDQNFSA